MRNDLTIVNGWVIPRIVIKKGELGKFIAKVRVELGFSQKDMAKLLGISPMTMSAIENRKRPISREQVNRFIHEMGLNDDEREGFLKLAIMNNVAIAAEKITTNLLGNKNCGSD